MSVTLDELRGTLVRLHAGRLQGGLSPAAADALVAALAEGRPVGEAAARAGLDPDLAGAVEDAGVQDLPAVLAGLARCTAEVEAHARQLRSAGSYPLVLAVGVLVAGLVIGPVASPALAALPGADTQPQVPMLAAVIVAAALLVLQSLLVLGRVRSGPLGRGWRLLESFAFVEQLRLYTLAGAAAPRAVRAAAGSGSAASRSAASRSAASRSAASRSAASRRAGLSLARALEAGRPAADLAPLLSPHETAVLIGAARSGALAETAAALAAQRRVALQRQIPQVAALIHATALVLAGLALLAVGLGFFTAYVHALLA